MGSSVAVAASAQPSSPPSPPRCDTTTGMTAAVRTRGRSLTSSSPRLWRKTNDDMRSSRFSSDVEPSEDESETELTASVRRDHILSLSPSDDLFFKGRLVPLEASSSFSTVAADTYSSESNERPQVAAFLLKSAAKFRVFKLGFQKKPRPTSVDPNVTASPAPTAASPKQPHQNKFFIKFKVDEVPIMSLFTRDNSSRNSGSSRSARLYADDAFPSSEDKKLSADAVMRYLSKIKPLYVRVSKRYGEKMRFSGPLNSGGAGKVGPAADGGEFPAVANKDSPSFLAGIRTEGQKLQSGSIPAGLRLVCQRLRKSRSASAAVAAVRSPPSAAARRDDTLLAQQDGIQSAIAHCKQSFNRGSGSPLMRSRSDPGDGRTM